MGASAKGKWRTVGARAEMTQRLGGSLWGGEGGGVKGRKGARSWRVVLGSARVEGEAMEEEKEVTKRGGGE